MKPVTLEAQELQIKELDNIIDRIFDVIFIETCTSILFLSLNKKLADGKKVKV